MRARTGDTTLRGSMGSSGGVRVRLADGVPDLGALGVESVRALLELDLGERAAVVSEDARDTLVRYPLPGTPRAPDEPAGARGRPRGAGTGWLVVRVYHGGALGERLFARLGSPPSGSLAEREWNILCHLRLHGVGTPEPLAVGALGAGLVARRSFLVTRELERTVTLERWARMEIDAATRARTLRALADALARAFRAGAWLPALRARHVHLAADECGLGTGTDGASCAADEPALPPRNRAPGVVLTGLARARLVRRVAPQRRAELVAALAAELADTRLAPLAPGTCRRALGRDLTRTQARAAWRAVERLA